MAEKKVGKVQNATIVVRAENGNKIIARSSCFENDQAVVLDRQVLELRREEGSIVIAVRDKERWESFNRTGLLAHFRYADHTEKTVEELVDDIVGLFGIDRR